MNTRKKIHVWYDATAGSNAAAWSYTGTSIDSNDNIYCASGVTHVNFILGTVNNGSTAAAVFQSSSPFSWYTAGSPGSPISQPACISDVQVSSDGYWASFVDDNSASGSYGVFLNITYNSQNIQSPDPTLINEGTTRVPVEA